MDIKKVSKFIGTVIGNLTSLFIIAFISKITYDVIAYEFNLPTFNVWVHFGMIYVSHQILHT